MSAQRFLDWAKLPIEETGEEEIRGFLDHLVSEKSLGTSTINVYNSALRFLFAVTLNRNLNYRQIPRFKQVFNLPTVLSRDEVSCILENTSTLRNKAVLMTIYGSGLRISEACKLRISDVDSKSMRIFVRRGKNRKDRFTLLSRANLDILRKYWKAYRPSHPDGWLFLNKDGSAMIHSRTIQSAFDAAVKRAGILKDVSTHTLRACFATHLLEDGADIYTVMRLLGHANIRTTTIYLNLVGFDSNLKSPLDAFLDKNQDGVAEVVGNA
jgi:site-specific recombinase XerD